MNTPQKSPTIIYWGTSEFAVKPLESLVQNFSVLAIVTTPDKPAGRKNMLTPSPVKVLAEKFGIKVFQPIKLDKVFTDELATIAADIFVVAAYGKIIPKYILELPEHGSLNIHPSLLPRWRGPSPIQAAILAGDDTTGVTIIQMDEKMDHGPVIAQKEVVITDETAPELSQVLSFESAKMITDMLPAWIEKRLVAKPQNDAEATFCKIIKKEDGEIDWTRPAMEISRHIRAFEPWPGSFTTWNRKEAPLKLKILKALVTEKIPAVTSKPGQVLIQNSSLFISTGNGVLEVLELQPEGKNPMTGASFINGYSAIAGAILC